MYCYENWASRPRDILAKKPPPGPSAEPRREKLSKFKIFKIEFLYKDKFWQKETRRGKKIL